MQAQLLIFFSLHSVLVRRMCLSLFTIANLKYWPLHFPHFVWCKKFWLGSWPRVSLSFPFFSHPASLVVDRQGGKAFETWPGFIVYMQAPERKLTRALASSQLLKEQQLWIVSWLEAPYSWLKKVQSQEAAACVKSSEVSGNTWDAEDNRGMEGNAALLVRIQQEKWEREETGCNKSHSKPRKWECTLCGTH